MPLFKPIQEKYINPYRTGFNKLVPAYNRMAKRANQRMRELEKKERKTGESTTYGAYRNVQRALGRQEGDIPKRFKENITMQQALHGMKDFEYQFMELQNFLNAKTSTLTGLKEIRIKREQKWKEKGIVFDTDEDFYNFLNSDLFHSMANQLDSDTIVEIFDQMREFETDEEITKQLQDLVDKYKQRQKTLSEKIMNQMVENAKRTAKKKGFKPRR